MLCERMQFHYRMSIVYLNFFFLHIELPFLKGDFVEEGNNVYDVRGTIAWNGVTYAVLQRKLAEKIPGYNGT